MGDTQELVALGIEIGLKEQAIISPLDSGNLAPKVRQDISDAQEVGVRSVPFFVFDRKYAVSGAQPPALFLEVLEKSFSEWTAERHF